MAGFNWGGFAANIGLGALSASNPIAGLVAGSIVGNLPDRKSKTPTSGLVRPQARPSPPSAFQNIGNSLAANAGDIFGAYQQRKVTKNAANAAIRGGQIDRDQRNKELAMQDPSYIRERFESAGFNPLLGIGNALSGLSYAPSMGQSIANAGSIMADGFHKSSLLKIQRTELDLENRRLNAQIKNMSLNRKVGGVYSRKGSRLGSANNKMKMPNDPNIDARYDDPPVPTFLKDFGGENMPYNEKVLPVFRAFGTNFYGSGAFTSGQTFEDAAGEGPLSWIHGVAVVGDAVLNTLTHSPWYSSHLDKRNKILTNAVLNSPPSEPAPTRFPYKAKAPRSNYARYPARAGF